jgi:hypothetical protein
MNSKQCLKTNINFLYENILLAKKKGCEFCFIPESFAMIGNKDFSLFESIEGETIKFLRKVAAENKIWLSLGGF